MYTGMVPCIAHVQVRLRGPQSLAHCVASQLSIYENAVLEQKRFYLVLKITQRAGHKNQRTGFDPQAACTLFTPDQI